MPNGDAYGKANGHVKADGGLNGDLNGSAGLSDRERRQMRSAEEFELDVLMSDDDEEEGMNGKKVGGGRV